MPLYKTSQEWLEQSGLLLQARPATTRITTKYSVKPIDSRPSRTSKDSEKADTPMTDAKLPRGRLVLKTYDPSSGVTLKYRTTKAAEVSRLILALGRLGRTMAALPATTGEPMEDVKEEGGEAKSSAAQQTQSPGPTRGASGGGKKKKKGKK